MGLVLGWSALFLRGAGYPARAGQMLWFAALGASAYLSPDPPFFVAGAVTGAIAHLLLQLGLEARSA